MKKASELCNIALDHIYLDKKGKIKFNPLGKDDLLFPGCRDKCVIEPIQKNLAEFVKLTAEQIEQSCGEKNYYLLKILWKQLKAISDTEQWKKFFYEKQ